MAKIYVFDDACIISSANLSLGAFQTNREIGVVFTGQETKRVTTFFSALWNDERACEVTAGDIKALFKRRNPGGAPKPTEKNDHHTNVEQWDKPEESLFPDTEEAADDVAPTSETGEWVSDRLDARVTAELKRRRLNRCDYVMPPIGVRAARKAYRPGSMFDASNERGNRNTTWKAGVWRTIGRVKDVFKVGSYVMVAYRVLRWCKVDSVLLRAAKKFNVYQGKPDGFEIRQYLDRVRSRPKK
ncbi:MAG TPA: hypothetical protein VIG51_09605 [Candidatus Baltobacteraceae bacterium]